MATADPVYNPNLQLGSATVGTGLSLSGGVLSNPSVAATYLVQTASSDLSAEQAMGSLATGLVKNTTTTGVQSIAAGGTDYAQATPREVYRARALSFLGLSSGDTTVFEDFEDFVRSSGVAAAGPAGWTASLVASGSVNITTAARAGGWVRVATGATGVSTSELFCRGTTIGALATTKWYAAFRFALNTTPGANSVILCCVTNAASTKSIGVGFRGSLNANNFIVQYDGIYTGTALDLAIAKDTASHVIEVYGATGSTTLSARIDGGSALTATMASAPTDTGLGFDLIAQNGATAADQSMDVDWAYMMGVRA
jgi:hypothetical protein